MLSPFSALNTNRSKKAIEDQHYLPLRPIKPMVSTEVSTEYEGLKEGNTTVHLHNHFNDTIIQDKPGYQYKKLFEETQESPEPKSKDSAIG